MNAMGRKRPEGASRRQRATLLFRGHRSSAGSGLSRAFAFAAILLSSFQIQGCLASSDGSIQFECPEEFGYYPHPEDCSKYYVCVFGGALMESCTRGLMYSNELQTCDWPRNVFCKRRDSGLLGEGTGFESGSEVLKSHASSDARHPRTLSEESAASFDDFGQRQVSYAQDQILRDHEVLVDEKGGSDRTSKRKVGQDSETRESSADDDHKAVESSSSSRDDTERSLFVEGPTASGHNDLDGDDDVMVEDVDDDDNEEEEEEDLLRAKPTELLHSPPVYETDEDVVVENDGDLDSVSYYDDYDGIDVDDNDGDNSFYYVSWEDPIYHDLVYDHHSGKKIKKANASSSSSGSNGRDGNVTVNYSPFPQRPPAIHPHVNNVVPGSEAKPCNRRRCRLPDCLCGKTKIREITGGRKPPQIVILTFDDSVNDLNRNLYKRVFAKHRVNPNGCPILATFYVSHEWTDYAQVQNLYADGHEIASHSISHSYGESFSRTEWLREMVGQRELLAAFAGVDVNDVKGLRAPFLAIGGDNMFSMMYEANFTYDSSMPVYENSPPSFPYTMDYKMAHDCMIPPCPEKAYPGLWEVPLVMWNDLGDGRCSMADACSNPSTAEDVYKLLMQNFQRHYLTNRAPFGLFYHAAWFTQPHHMLGFETFLDTLVELDDVWIVTTSQAIQFMRQLPKFAQATEHEVRNFPPFRCTEKKQRDYCTNPKVCNLWHKSGVRYMRTCQACPKSYPWTGNTGIANSLADTLN